MKIKHFFDQTTNTLTYVIADEKTSDAVIIDSVLDFDPETGKITQNSLHEVLDFVKAEGLHVRGILDTHAHADHLSGIHVLKEYFPDAPSCIGEGIRVVQEIFKEQLHLGYQKTDGSQFDILFKNNQTYKFGSLEMRAIATPGHTPACMSYLFDDVIFTGDALFIPDYGTGRCDFPKGSAVNLYHSVMDKLFKLPDATKVYVGHDYLPNGRELKFQTTIGESKNNNIHIKQNTSEQEYVTFREARDKTLKVPRLLIQSIQVNINGGAVPPGFPKA